MKAYPGSVVVGTDGTRITLLEPWPEAGLGEWKGRAVQRFGRREMVVRLQVSARQVGMAEDGVDGWSLEPGDMADDLRAFARNTP